MDAEQLRRAFTGFFVEREHALVASSGLIPHHPAAPLFANAGMNQFLPYFLGEEPAPYKRATSVQKCVRIRGKHDDIEIIGRSTRHLSFFEMLGNFSFGDYFKELAIPFHWELLTEVLGIDGDRLWATVHLDDDDAEQIWRDTVGLPAERIQRMGEDNFWEMGDTGPCGPSSEIYFDRGDDWGPGGGPLHGGEERFVEIGNLVFMQYDRQADRSLEPLPSRNIDTGSGLDRILPILQGVHSVFDTDVLRPVVDAAARATGRDYGADDDTDVVLRILADHARTITFLVSDGQTPSNEDRGYVLRRIIRRAVRQAYRLGVETSITSALVDATVATMGGAYPDLVANRDFIVDVVGREEARFRQSLKSGLAILDEALAEVESSPEPERRLTGSVAFRLHDTFGFPLELTLEVAAERDVSVDVAGFENEMERQRAQARGARTGPASTTGDRREVYRDLLDRFGPTRFTGYTETETKSRVLAVLPAETARRGVGAPTPREVGAGSVPNATDGGAPPGSGEAASHIELILEQTPFYAESGGQIGDTGRIATDTGEVEVVDTTYAAPGLVRHSARVVSGEIEAGQDATAAIDVERREAIRRNHTGTHILHWALRQVLGSQVKQAGSLVAPDRLRFDFNHHVAVSAEELDQVERLANLEVIENQSVRAYETSQPEAARLGAIAFFGDKYGDVVRVVEAGRNSVELCGGTHVGALGTIGPIKIISEASIGANLRRIEAVTGEASLDHIHREEATLERTATLLRVTPPEVPDRVEKLLEEQRALADRMKSLKRAGAGERARELATGAVDGVVVARVDDVDRDGLRDLAVAVRDQPGVEAVVLGAAPEGGGVALVAAAAKGSGFDASALIGDASRTVGGGGGKNPDLAVAGGRDASRLDEALEQARQAATGGRPSR